MSPGPTGTSSRPRSGVGTLRRFRADSDGVMLTIERENGQVVDLSCELPLARRLLERYGFHTSPTFTAISPIIGARIRYHETGCGMLTELEVLHN